MATAELVIAFDARADRLEASLKRVTTQLNKLETDVKATSSAIESNAGRMSQSFDGMATSLGRFAQAYLGFRGFQLLTQAAVAANELNASIGRLAILTNTSMSGAVDQFSRLQQIASATGQPVNDLTNQFTRFYTATASLGASREQVEQFVSSLANFSRLSAQGPQESAAAITQLAQGLASGRLQGDELKSILENMPLLATELARELNVSVGELRKMGEEGRLNAENVFPAVIRAGAALQARLEGLPLTLRQGWQVFEDAALSTIARIDRAWGATEWGAEIISRIGRRAEAVSRMRQGTGPEVSPQDRVMNIDARLAELARIQNEANRLLNNPTPRSTGPLAFLEQYNPEREADQARQRLQAANREAEDLQRTRSQALDTIAERSRLEAAEREEAGRNQRINEADANARTTRESANPILRAERDRDKAIADLEKTLADRRAAGRSTRELETFEREQRQSIALIFRRAQEAATAGARADAQREENERERAERQAAARALRLQRDQAAALQVIQGADRGSVRDITNLYDRINTPAIGSSAGSPIQEAIRAGIQLSEVFGAIQTQAIATGQAVQRAGGDMNPVLTTTQQTLERVRDRLIELGQPPEAVNQAFRTVADNAVEQLKRIEAQSKDTWNNIAVQGANAFANDLAGGLVEFAATGKAAFDELALNFIKNIAKMIAQAIILKGIQSALGTSGLGLISFPKRMAGGPVSAGQPYIVGERQPELFIPSSSGYIAPKVPGSSASITIVNNAPGVVVEQTQTPDDTIMVAVNMSRQRVAADFAESTRTGFGSYAEPLNSRYTMRRRI